MRAVEFPVALTAFAASNLIQLWALTVARWKIVVVKLGEGGLAEAIEFVSKAKWQAGLGSS